MPKCLYFLPGSLTDVAISCPFGGDDQQGLVYIYNGHSSGLREKPSQVIAGQWAAGTIPASFGFALRGAKDLDMNGYPGERLTPLPLLVTSGLHQGVF